MSSHLLNCFLLIYPPFELGNLQCPGAKPFKKVLPTSTYLWVPLVEIHSRFLGIYRWICSFMTINKTISEKISQTNQQVSYITNVNVVYIIEYALVRKNILVLCWLHIHILNGMKMACTTFRNKDSMTYGFTLIIWHSGYSIVCPYLISCSAF